MEEVPTAFSVLRVEEADEDNEGGFSLDVIARYRFIVGVMGWIKLSVRHKNPINTTM